MSPFERVAVACLHEAAERVMAAPLPSGVTTAAWAVQADGDTLEAAAGLTLALILAVEEAEQAAEAQVRAAQAALAEVRDVLAKVRAALAEVIEETGLPCVETPHHRATTSVSARSVVITDAAALPAAYLRHRDPEIDRNKLRSALLAGESISGATLTNGAPTLRISAKKGGA